MANIIKKNGRSSEPYSESKLFASVHAACLVVRAPLGEAELTAKKICQHVAAWLETKTEITSLDIRLHAAHHLRAYNPDAAYVYAHPVI